MKVLNWKLLSDKDKNACLQRPAQEDSQAIVMQAQKIIAQVQKGGDQALKQLSIQFDKVDLAGIQVSPAEFAATQNLNASVVTAINTAYQNIRSFHQAQLQPPIRVETQAGIICEKITRPIQKVGLYIPGGSAPLVSTTLMLGAPAQIAQCPQVVMCTPPNAQGNIDAHILYAAQLCGIKTIYKIGGAQAIAAMAYGTESVLKVDKLFGPGNAWVTAAKQIVAQDAKACSIDLPAGPSEVMVIADDKANPTFVAADLLSQAEHGPDSQVVLVCLSTEFAQNVQAQLQILLEKLSRKSIAEQSLAHSAMIVVEDLMEAVMIANHYAPEHLIIQTSDPRAILAHITCAGSIFLGAYAPESVGDYASGTNHVLPTYGYARNHSGLGLNDFLIHMSVQELTEAGLTALAPTVQTLAKIEGLDAHGLAVTLRIQESS